MKNIIIFKLLPLFLVVTFCACNDSFNEKGELVIVHKPSDKEIRIKYQDDGNIEYLQQYVNQNPEGIHLRFKKSEIKNISFVSAGKSDGMNVVFFNNGNINNFGKYSKGNKLGWFYVFGKDGNLINKREYISVGGTEYLNQWMDFFPDGSIDRVKSNYISLQALNDTIKYDDEYRLKVSLEAAYFKQFMLVITGPYDENFNLPPNATCDTLKSKDFAGTIITKKYKKGKNTLRGLVLDLRPDDKNPTKINTRKIYFSHDFLVR